MGTKQRLAEKYVELVELMMDCTIEHLRQVKASEEPISRETLLAASWPLGEITSNLYKIITDQVDATLP